MEGENELERLMKFDENGKLIRQDEFIEKFKESTLFLLVEFSNITIDDLEGMKIGDSFRVSDPLSFRINYLTDDEGRRAIPLFTSLEVMKKHGIKSSVTELTVPEIATMILEQGTPTNIMVINPLTEYSLDMSVEDFLEICSEEIDTINSILDFMREYSTSLEEDCLFYLRDDEDYMKNYSKGGMMVNPSPLNVNRKDEGGSGYLNIIEMPKDYMIFDVREFLEDGSFDTIIAPQSHFKLIDEDEKTRRWKCIKQEFYS